MLSPLRTALSPFIVPDLTRYVYLASAVPLLISLLICGSFRLLFFFHPESGPHDKFCGICVLVANQIDTILKNPKVAKAITTAVEAQLCTPLVGHFKNKVGITSTVVQ